LKLNIIEEHLKASSEVKLSLLSSVDKINQIIESLCNIIASGGRIYTCGNGGSSCDAMHFVEELVARFEKERPGIAAHHLCDSGILTCWANDYNFQDVFRRQVDTLVTDKDVLFALSTSGNSQNVINALEAANKIGATTVALLGKKGGKAKELAKISLVVPSDNTALIQEGHITIIHIICKGIEQNLYSS
jgi:phosphoheptose isomerase